MTRPVTASRGVGVAPFCRRFVADQRGQDLVEYALLSAVIGAAGLLLFPSIQESMRDAYERWSTPAREMTAP